MPYRTFWVFVIHCEMCILKNYEQNHTHSSLRWYHNFLYNMCIQCSIHIFWTLQAKNNVISSQFGRQRWSIFAIQKNNTIRMRISTSKLNNLNCEVDVLKLQIIDICKSNERTGIKWTKRKTMCTSRIGFETICCTLHTAHKHCACTRC